jgi:hypothetical protein
MGWMVRGSNAGGGEIFRNLPDRHWNPPSLLYNGYRVSFPGIKRPGRDVDHPPPSSAYVKEIVDLYLYSPSGSSRPVLGWTSRLLLPDRMSAGIPAILRYALSYFLHRLQNSSRILPCHTKITTAWCPILSSSSCCLFHSSKPESHSAAGACYSS